jgi:hypothetical protein
MRQHVPLPAKAPAEVTEDRLQEQKCGKRSNTAEREAPKNNASDKPSNREPAISVPLGKYCTLLKHVEIATEKVWMKKEQKASTGSRFPRAQGGKFPLC